MVVPRLRHRRRRAARRRADRHRARPCIRLSDEAETGVNLATTESIGENSITGGCLAITVFEGSEAHVESRHAETRALLEARGGTSLGEAPARAWEHGRFGAPYLRDSLLSAGALCETLETATNWSNMPALKAAVTEALTTALAESGTPALVLCHISHVYPTGASLYFTVVAGQRGNPIEQWRKAKTAASDAMMRTGATITHHHAVGADHRPWMRDEVGDLGVAGAAGRQGHARPGGNPQPRQADSVTQRKIGRVTVLTNPTSGHGNAPHAAERAVAQLQQRGVDVVAIAAPTPSTRDGSSTTPSSAASTHSWSSAVTASSRLRCRCWRRPTSRWASSRQAPATTMRANSRIPTKDPEAAADVVVDGWSRDRRPRPHRRRRRHRQKWFGTVMAAGFDSLVTDRTNRMRWPHGRMRYNLAMVAELSKLRLLPFRLSFDGGETIVTDLTLAAFGNTKSYGGGMLICPDADHTDGQLDVTMVHVGVADPADSLVPHRVQGHARRPRRGAHRRARARSPSTPPASTPTPTASTPARCRSRCRRCRAR